MVFVRALSADELWTGEMRGLVVGGRRVLLLRLDDGVRAYEDRCAHLGVPLSLGTLTGCVLTCSAHHFQYDARTGEGINPRVARLAPLRVREEGDHIVVDVDGSGARLVPLGEDDA